MPETPSTSIKFTEPDRALIERVKARYGTNTLRETILHSLRLADAAPGKAAKELRRKDTP